jgi:hypothetical protein
MIGKIITANTTATVIIVRPDAAAGPLNNGMNPTLSSNHGYTLRANTGANTNDPHNPYTTLGTAANRSMKYPNGAANRRGA